MEELLQIIKEMGIPLHMTILQREKVQIHRLSAISCQAVITLQLTEECI